jgi:hypothetical protein
VGRGSGPVKGRDRASAGSGVRRRAEVGHWDSGLGVGGWEYPVRGWRLRVVGRWGVDKLRFGALGVESWGVGAWQVGVWRLESGGQGLEVES